MTTLNKNVFCENAPKLKSEFYLRNVEDRNNEQFKLFKKCIMECEEEEQANGVILIDVLTEKIMVRNLNDFYENFKKSLPVLWK